MGPRVYCLEWGKKGPGRVSADCNDDQYGFVSPGSCRTAQASSGGDRAFMAMLKCTLEVWRHCRCNWCALREANHSRATLDHRILTNPAMAG